GGRRLWLSTQRPPASTVAVVRDAVAAVRPTRLPVGDAGGTRLGQLHQAAKEEQGLRSRDVGEELGVDLLDDGDRLWGEPCSSPGHTQPAGAGIGRIDLAFDQ